MKFGGTSVADAQRIKRAAKRIVEKREAGLQRRGGALRPRQHHRRAHRDGRGGLAAPDPREMDMLLSTGERISCALCAMAIHDLGHRAISLTGSQAGIVTDTSHTKARILDVRADRIRAALAEDNIVLVAGFQGVSTADDVTTLGRGARTRRAVAVAAALGADDCEIYTDVDGVLHAPIPASCPTRASSTTSPSRRCSRWLPRARACCSCARVEYARNHGVRIHCRSSFDDRPGTVVVAEGETRWSSPHHSRHPFDVGGARHADRRARRARRSRAHLRGAGRAPT